MVPSTTQEYFCKWLGYGITGVAARNCNSCNLETYMCSHSGEFCVAKEGLEEFAQSLTEGSSKITLEMFQSARQKMENEKRQKIYKEIAKMWTDKHGED